jgi:hypothetical protein
MAERTSTNAHRDPGAWQDASQIDDKDRKRNPKRHETPQSAKLLRPAATTLRANYGMARRLLGFEEG